MLRIETDRLLLRTPTEDDLYDYLSYRNHPEKLEDDAHVAISAEEAQGFLKEQQTSLQDSTGWKMLAIEPKHKQLEQSVVGEVGVFISTNEAKSGDMGWWLHPQARSQGLAAEAAHALLHWCFQTLEFHRVTAACLARNERSLRLMERLGMRVEARRLQSRRVGGQWLDEIECALLSSEWRLRQPS